MTTDSRIEELMKRVLASCLCRKAELNNLMAQNLQESQAEQFNKVIAEVKALIEKNGLTITEVVKALGGSGSSVVKPYFKVPYLDGKGKEKFYEWHPTKKPWAFRQSMLKLKNADAETKTSWATAEGKEWLKTDDGKRFLVNAE